jgi:neutral ceramidase
VCDKTTITLIAGTSIPPGGEFQLKNKFLIALVLFGSLTCISAAEYRAGAAQVVITPPRGMPMAGYYYVRLNEGTHDDLHAKAIVIEGRSNKVALVGLDLVHIPRNFVEAARSQIEKETGIPGDHVMISATHSHTGPELGSRLKGVDSATESLAQSYYKILPGKIAESVRLANAALTPVTISAGVGHEDSVSFIRRYFMTDGSVGWNPGKLNPKIVRPAGKIDPDIAVVSFQSPERRPLAAYVNFANHLDTMGGMQFSADYAYTLAKDLADAKGPEMLTLFTNGCAGNINHVDVSRAEPQKGALESARIGTVLAGDVLKTWPHLRELTPGPIQVRSQIVPLPLAPYAPEDVAKAREVVAAYGKPNSRPFYDQVYAFKVMELEERKHKPLEAEVQVIALGRDVAWVGLPGEIFVELGKTIKLASPFRQTIIAELANGSLGYIPDRKAYAQGAYEPISARMAAGSGEKLVDAASAMLIDLFETGK